MKKIVIVGHPNVGKSALFNALTGSYVTVSNYPGTTVELFQGRSSLLGPDTEVIDTPGMYSLLPISQEEAIARDILSSGDVRAILHVVDAKNIDRMLGLTLQLAEAGLPVILVLNMMDECETIGVKIERERLEAAIGVPVVATVSVTGEGVATLADRIRALPPESAKRPVDYGPGIERAVQALVGYLDERPGLSRRTRALLLLMGDVAERGRLVREKGDHAASALLKELSHQQALMDHSPHYQAMLALKQVVDRVLARTVVYPRRIFHGIREKLNLFCIHPLTGFPLLAAVLYFGFYKLVGQFGAGFLVDWIDTAVFESWINPWATRGIEALIPWPVMQSLFCGEYGLVTLGLRYAVAIVLPIVGMFFLMFSILEDSGYLPRLSMLMDRVFKKIGLNGRAVIPIVLGFGCDTMATLVTRTLETRRERMIATILLALTIPCSAQLGVILGLLSKNPASLAIWGVVMAGIFMACGTVVARFLPGEKPSFYMEMPPLRWPRPQNILVKTLSRMVWYFKEVLPLFLLASLLIWLGDITHIFQLLLDGLTPVVEGIGLPAKAASAFLYGFFRRDFGAAGLYDLQHQGLLSGNQLLVASVTLTLFLPCVAQFMIMKKEQGLRFTLGVSAGVFLIAFLTGFCLNTVLNLLGMTL